ncbi:hypothetical protein HMPREF0980_02013 [Dorea sp. D27]|nr:hypothetical protein HMPREF0980_02013 [Dorea sp. D27]
MKYMTVRQAGEKWNRSRRWGQVLCQNGRIEGAYRPARDWPIPAAECPAGWRRRENREGDRA